MIATDLPLFCSQPNTSLAILATEQAVLIAYERERDFLSAPRAFVICQAPAESLVNLNSCHATEAQWLILEANPFGVYHYRYDNRPFYVFYAVNQLIDLQTESLSQHKEIYHCANAGEALVKFFNKEHAL
jgi:hypothetical protein